MASKPQTQVTYRCNKEQYLGTSTLPSNGAKSFACEVCGLKLFVDADKMEFGANGHTPKTIQHDLLQLKEIGVEK